MASAPAPHRPVRGPVPQNLGLRGNWFGRKVSTPMLKRRPPTFRDVILAAQQGVCCKGAEVSDEARMLGAHASAFVDRCQTFAMAAASSKVPGW